MRKKFVRISITLPADLLSEFDSLVKERKYFKRSEAVRDSLRSFITENKWQYDINSRFTGALLFTYDHDVPGISDYLTRIQHRFHSNIKTTIHLHLDLHKCLEMLAVEGEGRVLRELADTLGHRKGVEVSRLVLVK